jgi:hypothetical protein
MLATKDLQLWIPGEGSYADRSWYGRTVSLWDGGANGSFNAPTLITPAKYGRGYGFNETATTQEQALEVAIADPGQQQTWLCWFRSAASLTGQRLIMKHRTALTSNRIYIEIDGGQLATRFGATQRLSGVSPTVGQWYHLAYRFDRSAPSQAFFINGTRVTNTTDAFPDNSWSGYIQIGVYNERTGVISWATSAIRAALDEIKVYSRLLTDDEILADMQDQEPYHG